MISMVDLHYNHYYFKNVDCSDLIDSELLVLSDIVSSKQNFSPQVEAMLSENLCQYYNGTSKCQDFLSGVGVRGLRSYIYQIREIYAQERTNLRGKNYTVAMLTELSLRPYRNDMYGMMTGAVIPATKVFISRLGDTMLDYLSTQIDSIVKDFVASVVVDLLSLVSMITLVYKIMIKERKRVFNTVNMIPLEFILISKHFKMYMIKENKEFNRLFKSSEQLKKNFIKKNNK